MNYTLLLKVSRRKDFSGMDMWMRSRTRDNHENKKLAVLGTTWKKTKARGNDK